MRLKVTIQIPESVLGLRNGEGVIWSGRPRQGLLLRSSDLLLIPFSLLWGGFAIVWEGTVLKYHLPGSLALVGALFVAIGLYLMVGRFFLDARQRALTYYLLTNQRVIISSSLFWRSIKSLNLWSLPSLSFSETADGRGTIFFGPQLHWWDDDAGTVPIFEGIEQARDVYELIRKAQAEA